jgi:nucleoside-diphosphate-sugar epimerase
MTRYPHLLSKSSIKLFQDLSIAKQRFVITGASGWLGKTFVALANSAGHDLMLVGSHQRSMTIDNQDFEVEKYELNAIEQFNPTVLIDFAFVTREHLGKTSDEEYRQVNNRLIDQALKVFALPTVRYGMFTSSGAAVYPEDALLGQFSENPYGYLKRRTEEMVLQESERLDKKSIVIRPWSLSGTMVTKDYEFAFSSFIRQSFGNLIEVKSPNPVYRRYVSAEDFLALSVAKLFSQSNSAEIFDSGGDLVSLVDLAHKIADLQTKKVSVVSRQSNPEASNNYYSDNRQWIQECEAFGFVPENLNEQISRNLEYYRAIR